MKKGHMGIWEDCMSFMQRKVASWLGEVMSEVVRNGYIQDQSADLHQEEMRKRAAQAKGRAVTLTKIGKLDCASEGGC